jgi:hypothetical protein
MPDGSIGTLTPVLSFRAALERMVSWFERPERRSLRLLVFGLLVAIPGVFELSRVHPAPWSIQGGRANGLNWTLDSLHHGGPVLTMLIPHSTTFAPSGGGDDQGLYLFVPWLANVLEWQQPVNLLRWIALIAFGVTITLAPWAVRELSGSTLAALATPVPLVFGLWLIPLSDIYWISAWVILTLVPIVMVLDRRWPRHGLPMLLGLLVLASVASAVRNQAGAPVLFAGLLVVARLPWSRSARVSAMAMCLVAYLSVSSVAIGVARGERNSALEHRGLVEPNGHGHPFWHTAYLGLGYLPNQWGIRYQDGVAYRDVLREEPRARFLGPAYGRTLRHRYFKLVADDPVYAFRDYTAKMLVAVRPATPALLIVAAFAPWLLLRDRRRARWRRDALLLAPAILIALSAPLLATPDSGYLLGWLAVALLSAILTAAALAATVVPGLPAARRPSSRAWGLDRRVVVSTIVSIVVVCLTFVVAPPIRDSALNWLNAKPPPQVAQPPNADK